MGTLATCVEHEFPCCKMLFKSYSKELSLLKLLIMEGTCSMSPWNIQGIIHVIPVVSFLPSFFRNNLSSNHSFRFLQAVQNAL